MSQQRLIPEEGHSAPMSCQTPEQQQGQPSALAEPKASVAGAPAAEAVSAAPSALAIQLRREARVRRHEAVDSATLTGMFVMGMAWTLHRLLTEPDQYPLNLRIGLVLIAAYALGIFAQMARRSYRRERSLTQALAQSRDKQQIATLVQTLKVENTGVRNLAKRTLIELLPTLHASDTVLLGEAERDILLRQLSISPNDSGYRDLTELFSRSAVRREIDLRLSILKALEQVGGTKELSAVERLACGRPTLNSQAPIPIEVREAALQCLPYLQSRATAHLASRQLLRASSAAATTGDTLLRAATATRQDAAADQLVRAAHGSQ